MESQKSNCVMNVLPVYIDDWLSSQSIEDMDADEERGYFRLCLHAAKLEQSGLPKDERLLSNWSRLHAQWNKPTRDKKFRSGLTSGQKILRNFFEKDGHLFNSRVLACVEHYRERQELAQKAANRRWGKGNADAMQMHMHPHCEGNATRVGNGNIGASLGEGSGEGEPLDRQVIAWQLAEDLHSHHPVACSLPMARRAAELEIVKYPEMDPVGWAADVRRTYAKHLEQWRRERREKPSSYVPILQIWFREEMYLQRAMGAAANPAPRGLKAGEIE